jgi:CBS domain-containing protein
MTVKAILSRKGSDVVTIAPTASLTDAVKLLAQRRIGAVVVTGSVMTRKVTTCTEADTIASLMERMTAGKFRHLPVVEQGKLVGVISIGDVVKWRVEEVEGESAALREYIATA